MSGPSPEAAAFAGAVTFVRAHAVDPEQADLLVAALDARPDRDQGIGGEGYRRFVRIPRAVAAAVCGDAARADPIAAALALLHTGLDTLDDLMDGDARPWWQGRRPAEVLLAGATLVSALPQALLAELDAPPATVALMLRTLAQSGLVISAGQQRDITAAGRDDRTAEQVEALVAAKSGEVHALAAALAAQIAGAGAETVDRYRRYGRAIGTASQIASDCYDIFVAPESRDLRAGARTLPIVLAIRSLSGERRDAFLALLQQAEGDAAARTTLRHRLIDAGIVHTCALVVALHCRHAYAALAESGASGPARDQLGQIIRDCSLIAETLTGA